MSYARIYATMLTRKRKAHSEKSTSVTLPASGDRMPLVGLGTWKSSPGVVGDAVRSAVSAGYRHIDCAHCYNNEKEVGETLAELIASGVVRRDELFITSKLWNTKHGQDQVVPALEHTLEQLQLTYVDLYLIHWPHAFQCTDLPSENFPKRPDGTGPVYDLELHFTETWKGMEQASRLGLSRNIGLSNFNSKQVDQVSSSECEHRGCARDVHI